MFLLKQPGIRRRLVRSLSTCPSCYSSLPTPLPACPNCSYISHIPSNTPYHHIFGLPEQQNPFIIDPSQLTTRFRDIQRVIHPDAWSVKGNNKQEIAASLSSFVNSAYKALHRPLPRLEYILSQHDLQTNEEDDLQDTELIAAVLEARETLEEASSKDEVMKLRSENQAKIDELLPEIEALVENKAWEELKTAAIKLKYLEGIVGAADAWPERVFDH